MRVTTYPLCSVLMSSTIAFVAAKRFLASSDEAPAAGWLRSTPLRSQISSLYVPLRFSFVARVLTTSESDALSTSSSSSADIEAGSRIGGGNSNSRFALISRCLQVRLVSGWTITPSFTRMALPFPNSSSTNS